MSDNTESPKKNITPDWLVQGALVRIGDMFDKLTGRSWKPASSLATSGLIERMKTLLTSEIRRDDAGRNFVPHNITLKMQWDKFSTDAEHALRKLENELLTAAVDFISDNRYYTHAPLKLEVKPDYFTEGVKLFVSYDRFDEERGERELNVTIPAAKVSDLIPAGIETDMSKQFGGPMKQTGQLVVRYDVGKGPVEKRFELEQGRRLTIGRTKENDIALDDSSVSKMHASLLLNSEGKLVVADTGSTNGTYLNEERIAYGKAIEIFAEDKVKFGAVDVIMELPQNRIDTEDQVAADVPTEAYTVGDFQFSKKTEVLKPAVKKDLERPETTIPSPPTESDGND
jgi:pSer/pThr/pTyr-binding forkhead associated (FHA) protein